MSLHKKHLMKSKKTQLLFLFGISILSLVSLLFLFQNSPSKLSPIVNKTYWFILHRQSNREELFMGVAGDRTKSKHIKTFVVKTGISGQRPTPLPKLLGREYWLIVEKHPEPDNPETAPYFLTLDIPSPTGTPFGPVPYLECQGQCNWVRPGDFGLHGINGDTERLSTTNLGSSGCIRHTDEDITYLYDLLDPTKQEIRYYVEDN